MTEPYPQHLYPRCPCFRCDQADTPEWPGLPGFKIPTRMSLCPTCGNKRCPGAADHNKVCSGSNDPGQEGSLYA